MSLAQLQKLQNASHVQLSGVLETYSVSAQLVDAVLGREVFNDGMVVQILVSSFDSKMEN